MPARYELPWPKLMRLLVVIAWLANSSREKIAATEVDAEVMALLKSRCVKCHGPAKQEAKLNLSTAHGLARGGKSGPIVAPHDLQASLLWKQIESDEMPPDDPLPPSEKGRLKKWIVGGAAGLPPPGTTPPSSLDHWSFQKLAVAQVPPITNGHRIAGSVDRFVQAKLESAQLELGTPAPRTTLIRRVGYLLTGLPPSPAEVDEYVHDAAPDAHARMVERYLASPHYGERWGKIWLDAAGYADSNGYFNADSDRPLAYRYRDYVIRALNADRPFDQFIREQLAGDELAGYVPDQPATPRMIELLEATHYLRNGQDGSSESDGNPDELRVDRYTALESCLQNVVTSLFGLTIQCAKCHDHKFEPISQRDYYRLQAVFYPVFPAAHGEAWIKPKDRAIHANLPGEQAEWEQRRRQAQDHASALRTSLVTWVRDHRPRGEVLFEDRFDSKSLSERWSAAAPTDDVPGGKVPVRLDNDVPPAARIQDEQLQILAGGTDGDSWISTRQAFDWSPDQKGESIQVTFDLLRDRLAEQGTAAQRIGYLLALHDFNDNSATPGGNILVDGNPGGATNLYYDYPGSDSAGRDKIGSTGYEPGRNYGVRITNDGDGKYRIEQVVDGLPEEPAAIGSAADLPAGGFGFEYCCGRSFVVDNVVIERFPSPSTEQDPQRVEFGKQLAARRQELDRAAKQATELAQNRPGRIAWASDVSASPPETHLLVRGNYAQPGEAISPAGFAALSDQNRQLNLVAPPPDSRTTGRRTAWADWVTHPDSRAAALLARVQVNRVWQHYFGTGIAATPENLGLSGAAPTHPELIEWLATEFIRSGWSLKHVNRLILNSETFCQSSETTKNAPLTVAESSWTTRFPPRRLDAEAIRDGMLAISGDLDDRFGGPYIPTTRETSGEVVVPESQAGVRRRSIYLQQRRTQVTSLLQVFDAPSIVFNSTRRSSSTMPLQSLSLLNSEFVLARARSLADRLERERSDEPARLAWAYERIFARSAGTDELAAAHRFLDEQTRERGSGHDARRRAWRDLCQALLISNEALYVD